MPQNFLFHWMLQTTRYWSFLFTVLHLIKWLMHMHPPHLSSTNGVHIHILLVVLVFCLGRPSYLITYKDPVHIYVLSSVYRNALSTGLYHTQTTDYAVLSLVI